jgi:predicted adenylyl cyclase CyaB
MPTNIEIKARASAWDRQHRLAQQLCGCSAQRIVQEDVFFHAQSGRLKLRIFSPTTGELIRYSRPDTPGPKLSDYAISRTSDPAGLRAVLADSLGIRGVVRKQRDLYLAGQTRIHFDDVEGLGRFIELEVVLRDDQDHVDGVPVAERLMAALEIRPDDLVDGAYVDLLGL